MQLDGLIVGLGNPGKEYEATRHNFGFMVAEALLERCERLGSISKLSGQKDPFILWRCTIRQKEQTNWLVTMPLTFMNKSGEAVQRIADYYHVNAENIFVLHDELDIPLGRMKMKKGGGHAGHNGIRSIQQMLGTPEFHRLRLGIGKPAGFDTASYVLGRFNSEQKESLAATISAAVEGTLLFINEGLRPAQQFCNGFSAEPVHSTPPASSSKP